MTPNPPVLPLGLQQFLPEPESPEITVAMPEPKDPAIEEELHEAARRLLAYNRDYQDEALVENWTQAYQYYRGEAPGPTDCQDSTVVSTDFSDTVEWLLPAILKPLIASPDVVRFDPASPEDVEQAALESDYVHHVFMKKCNGFEKLYTHIKDALILKNSVFCTYWDSSFKSQKERYRDLTEVELADLLHPADGSKVKLVSRTAREAPLIDENTGVPLPPQQPPASPAPQGAPRPPQGAQAPSAPPPPPTAETRYDVCVRRFWPRGQPVVENCAPEAFGVDLAHDSINLENARFCWYTLYKTRSELVALGYDEDTIDDCPKGTDTFDNEVRYAREDVERERSAWRDAGTEKEESRALYEVHRVYMRYDADDDGFDEHYLVVLGGHQGEVIFDHFEVPENPFSASTPFIAGHKFYGYSLFDKLRELADHKTKVLRMLEDNLDLANNPRIKGVRGMFVLDDVLTRQVGGIWRVDDPNALQEVPVQPIQTQGQQLLQYYDKMRAERSGVDPNAQSLAQLPEESMNHAVERVFSAKEELVGMLIRTFAETGVRQMFLKLRGVLMRNMNKDQMVQLRNKWVTINPANWIERTDSTIVVGLGTGDKMRKSAALQQVLQVQMQAMQGGMSGVLVSPQRMAHTIKEFVRMQELGDPEDFVLDPSFLLDPRNLRTKRGQETLQAQQFAMQMAQQQQQAEMAKAQAQMQLQQALLASQKEVAQIQAESGVMKAQIQEQARAQTSMESLRAEMARFQKEMELKWAELAAKETAQEDALVVEQAKLQVGLMQKQIDAAQKDQDRQVDVAKARADSDHRMEDRKQAERKMYYDTTNKTADRESKERQSEQAAKAKKPEGSK